ncbi:hypothetical protein E3O53_07990 [Cryobacterium sp. TMT2-18-3]|uniref:hypothetical protein n=1 Tax=unclassified Cryobacterium TaxID=2649013 RepID=UPI00106BE3B7|nr:MULTISPECIES: hypothetical protein [unclassified Cryobacterium]TFC26412.1 hypothetical protein E3O22_12315 [Cryobacterium sp. TMT2-18-2]TFC64409.1 hypothetical protein E3O53_07990 [Cryobacterium sp. TMT2-18-3]
MTTIPLTNFPDFADVRRRAIARWITHYSVQPGSDPVTAFVLSCDSLLTAALANGPQFTEDEALGMLAMYQGTTPSAFIFGTLLAQDMQDDPDIYEPTAQLMAKLSSLTLTQDWALRQLLAVHEERRRNESGLTLQELGFPIK